jgi:hypothetical protein
MSELNINHDRHTAALLRLATTSKKTAVEVLRQEAKLVIVEAAKITPPQFNTTQGRSAEVYGKAAIASDISSMYGTPNDAYMQLRGIMPAAAASFWAKKSAGDDAGASQVLRNVTGASFSPFDGGQIHKNFGSQAIGRRRLRPRILMFVRNPEAIDRYIEKIQSRIWFLASGWVPAMTSLGARIPYGLNKQNAPGNLIVDVDDRRIIIRMQNAAPFARNVKGIEKRIRFALDVRTSRMQKNWDNYIKRASRDF